MDPLVTLLLGNLRRHILECIEACVDKGNIHRKKLERNILRKSFVMCEFISQSYIILFMKQFGRTLLGESEKRYLGHIEAYDDKGNIIN